jgi:CRISPR/Cas system CSM-associated protein Csm3 (group 7 of RAMP superfamily)
MIRFEIVVEPYGSLFVGGYARAVGGSDGDTASDALGMLLPGSAIKGALRESAARLVHAVGRGEDLLITLFGNAEKPGLLRVGTLRPGLDAEEAIGVQEGTVRNHVSLERATRQAAPQRLFQNRVTPALKGLHFRGVVESRESLEGDALGLLESAVRITDQIGGGRGRGLGLVKVSLTRLPPEDPRPARGLGEQTTTIVLALEAEEPLHLSSVKEAGNYITSKDFLDGSSIRGAVAAALAVREAELDRLLGGQAPAVFGDGRPGGACAIPAPMTLKEPKRGGPANDEAAFLCAEACGCPAAARPEDTRTAHGTWVWGATGWVPFPVKRRTVTRTARDHATGRAADGQLFSLEVVDPVLERPNLVSGRRLCFHVPVWGSRDQLDLVLQAAEAGLVVGGDRSRGFGRLRLINVETETTLPPLDKRHARWAELVGRLGVEHPEATGALLALGPVAVGHERLKAAFAAVDVELLDGVARRQTHGGWNAKAHLPRSLSNHLLPGSIFIVRRRGGLSAREALAELETRGIGPGRADGWGRLVACHPIHVDCFKEG